ncbi:protein-tyrosine phosphatase [Devosia sp. UYZn731]|uniref:tyrosine-protein phosphatase n=1 Tax=Devosia sp. UYZn731 TaxID=3156345 RepID=UPI003397DA81
MQTPFKRHLPVNGTFNIRDLGGYATAEGETRWRRVLRADGLHRLDEDGMATLVNEGVTTVIDLRHSGELVHQPNPFSANPAVAYHNVSLFDSLAPSLDHDGDVLYALYVMALAERQGAIKQVLTIIADAPEGVVLFHCTAGKDRTGIISALLLAIAGVQAELIAEDYSLTADMIAPMVEDIIADAVSRGGNVDQFRPMLASNYETMAATINHIVGTYGSPDAYLSQHVGLDAATIEQLRDRLTGEA